MRVPQKAVADLSSELQTLKTMQAADLDDDERISYESKPKRRGSKGELKPVAKPRRPSGGGAKEEQEDQRLALIQKENEIAALRVKSERLASEATEWREKYEEELAAARNSRVRENASYQVERSVEFSPGSLSKDQSKSLARQRIRARSAKRREAKSGSNRRLDEPVDDPAKMAVMLANFVEYLALVDNLADEPSEEILEQANRIRQLLATQSVSPPPESALAALPEELADALPESPDTEEAQALHAGIWGRLAREGVLLLSGTRVPLGADSTQLSGAVVEVADAVLLGAWVHVRGAFTSIDFKGEGNAVPVRQVVGLDPSHSVNLSDKQYGRLEAVLIASALTSNPVLTSLILTHNALGPAGTKPIAAMLRTNTCITKIELARCELGTEGAALVAEALGENCTVEHLNMSSNSLGVDGAAKIADLLSASSTLKSLVLRNNGFGDAGTVRIGEALTSNEALVSLVLAGNGIGAEGTSSIATALRTNAHLMDLDLQENAVNAEGLAALAEALVSNADSVLAVLALKGNRVARSGVTGGSYSSAGIEALTALLQSSETLTHVDLRNNDVHKKEREALLGIGDGGGDNGSDYSTPKKATATGLVLV